MRWIDALWLTVLAALLFGLIWATHAPPQPVPAPCCAAGDVPPDGILAAPKCDCKGRKCNCCDACPRNRDKRRGEQPAPAIKEEP